jgi:hypothetical protein
MSRAPARQPGLARRSARSCRAPTHWGLDLRIQHGLLVAGLAQVSACGPTHQVLVDPVLDLVREGRYRPHELPLVGLEHDLAEDRQRCAPPVSLSPRARLSSKPIRDRHRDPLRSVGRPHEERIAEVARRSGFSHHRDREVAAMQGVGGAFLNANVYGVALLLIAMLLSVSLGTALRSLTGPCTESHASPGCLLT